MSWQPMTYGRWTYFRESLHRSRTDEQSRAEREARRAIEDREAERALAARIQDPWEKYLSEDQA